MKLCCNFKYLISKKYGDIFYLRLWETNYEFYAKKKKKKKKKNSRYHAEHYALLFNRYNTQKITAFISTDA